MVIRSVSALLIDFIYVNLVIWFVILGPVCVGAASPPQIVVNSKLVRDFSHYNLWFSNPDTRISNQICWADSINNSTEIFLQNAVDMCYRYEYTPKQLYASQVSWKIKSNKETTSNGTQSDVEDSTKGDAVYKHLAFLLLYPAHPPSTTMYDSVNSIAHMFPTVHFVIGRADEFNDMIETFGMKFFPVIVLFEDGLLSDYHSELHEPWTMASIIAKWAQTFPKAYPAYKKHQIFTSFSPAKLRNLSRKKRNTTISQIISEMESSEFAHERAVLAGRLLGQKALYYCDNIEESIVAAMNYLALGNLVDQFCFEPMMGTFSSLMNYDNTIFAIAGIYSMVRIYIGVRNKWKRREN